jgi:8-oxo-dGTP pyrophosphatase MutT (NUDIX family)
MLDQTHRFAGAFIIDTQQNLILQLRDNKQGIRNPGAVSVFGGAVEAGETYVDGLVREIFEELALKVDRHDLAFLGSEQKVENDLSTDCEFYVLRNIDLSRCTVSEGCAITLAPAEALGDARMTPICTTMLRKLLEII